MTGRSIWYSTDGREPFACLSFSGSRYSLSVYASGSATDVEVLRETFVDSLDLNLRSSDDDPSHATSEQRTTQDTVQLSSEQPLRCFLSYRFSESNEAVASRVRHFLELAGVEVVTGSPYEPRRVTEKVRDMLSQPLDLIVLLVTREGESEWTRDEIGTAAHRGIPLVPIVEKGQQFVQGLFGDQEYIEFSPDHIGDAFFKLLQAVVFARTNAR